MNASFGNKGTAMRKEKPKRKQTFWYNGNIRKEEFLNQNGEYHNESGPACRWWYSNGQLEYEAHWRNGKFHNAAGPVREWHEDGRLACEAHYLNGERHNSAGPAARWWHENGQLAYEAYYLNDRPLTYQALLRDCSVIKEQQ
jgi:antitoxin component YwqK of YwqJK toxin-antitoxin module